MEIVTGVEYAKFGAHALSVSTQYKVAPQPEPPASAQVKVTITPFSVQLPKTYALPFEVALAAVTGAVVSHNKLNVKALWLVAMSAE